jgi:heat shock protein HslJ
MALTLQPGAMTAVACAAGSLGDQYVALLGQVAGFTFDGDDLLLSVADGPLLRLVNGGPFTGGESAEVVADPDGPTAAPLAGVWRWATFRDAKQEYAVPATTDYTLAFNDDGTVAVVADCNSGTGTYTVNSDGTLTIVVQVLTRAACPPGSLSDSFIEYLNQAGPFEVDDTGTLIIDLMADGGRMTFVLEP